jgi:copper oxidase (laccase) domain-containing protein
VSTRSGGFGESPYHFLNLGPDVISRFCKVFHRTEEQLILKSSSNSEGYLDLWQATIEQLLQVGVKRERIELAGRL